MNAFNKASKMIGSIINKKASVSDVDITCEQVIDLSGWLGEYISGSSSVSAREALNFYAKSTVVSNPVNKITDAFVDTNFILKFKSPNGEEIIRDHPVINLLNNPSADYDEKLFKACMSIYYLLTGEFFTVVIGPDSKPPIELNPIMPPNVTHSKGSDGFLSALSVAGDSFIGKYTRDQSFRGQKFVRDNLTQLIFIRNFSTVSNSQLRGQSPLTAARQDILTSIAGGEHNHAILKNGGRISMAVNIKDELNTRTFDEAKERIRQQVTGANAGQVMVIDSKEMTIQEYGVTNKDMDYQNMMKSIKETLYSTYNVPLTLASTDAATYNNLGASFEALYDNAVIPLASRICAGLDVTLLPRYGLDPAKYSLGIDIDAIPALRKRRLEELKLRVSLNKETTNEYRELLGREDYANGDTIQQAATLVALSGSVNENDLPTNPDDVKVAE